MTNNYLYWSLKRAGKERLFCYTPHRQPGGRFATFERVTYSNGISRTIRVVWFSRRKTAKKHAYQWYQKALAA